MLDIAHTWRGARNEKKIIVIAALIALAGLLAFGVVDRTQAGNISADEIEGLLYIREIEKLAHDIYTTSYALYRVRIFQNIAGSEQNHMDVMKMLLDRYGLPDPASKKKGVFTDPDIQALYNQLISHSRQSLTEAYRVGVDIEVLDIADLQHYLSLTTHADILQVYTNLLNASYNHLAAFQSKLR